MAIESPDFQTIGSAALVIISVWLVKFAQKYKAAHEGAMPESAVPVIGNMDGFAAAISRALDAREAIQAKLDVVADKVSEVRHQMLNELQKQIATLVLSIRDVVKSIAELEKRVRAVEVAQAVAGGRLPKKKRKKPRARIKKAPASVPAKGL